MSLEYSNDNDRLLIVVDMQNDFIDGALGTPKAQSIVPKVVKKIKNWDEDIIYTMDTHGENYLSTNEGKHLPVPHCIEGTEGHKINKDVLDAMTNKEAYVANNYHIIHKPTFGSLELPYIIGDNKYNYIEIVGLCTDICIVSNALLLKAHYPEIDIAVDASCCAGVTPESHEAALTVMKMCQIDIIGEV